MNAAVGLYMRGTAHIGETRLFGPLDISLPVGRWTCLLGPSGVGKSTILKLFADLADGVQLNGDFGATDNAPLTGRVAVMAQEDLLMPWLDLRRNVSLGARLRGEKRNLTRAEQLLSDVGLAGHMDKRPAALSGGQRQRVALARTLMEDRPVVLLDEPFSALDARTRADMQDLAATMLHGRTVLHVTHDPAEAARLGQQILVLTETGVHNIPAPDTAIPRPVDSADVLQFQSQLLNELRKAPAVDQQT